MIERTTKTFKCPKCGLEYKCQDGCKCPSCGYETQAPQPMVIIK